MRIDIVSIFPDYLAPLELSLPGKARAAGLLDVDVHDLRDWTHDRHRTVDDTPYGGGAGMVMRPEPWGEALDTLLRPGSTLVVPTPSGERFTQSLARELSTREHLVFACGRYEGIDQRVMDHFGGGHEVREVSIGDYVLNGGEVAALAITEAVVRLIDRPAAGNLQWSGDHPDPATSLAPWRVYNIGNNQPVEVTEVVRLLEQELGRPAQRELLPMQPGDVPATYADIGDLDRKPCRHQQQTRGEGPRQRVTDHSVPTHTMVPSATKWSQAPTQAPATPRSGLGLEQEAPQQEIPSHRRNDDRDI